MDLIGINEEKMDALSKEIISLGEQMDKVLSKISDLVTDSEAYFQCDTGKLLRNRFDYIRNIIPLIPKTMNNYSTVITKAKTNMLDLGDDVAKETGVATAKVNTETLKQGGEVNGWIRDN